MKKSRVLLAVLLLVVAMFVLSFLITITASRMIPPKEHIGKAGQPTPAAPSSAEASGELRHPQDQVAQDPTAAARAYSFSTEPDAARLREDTIERGAAAFKDSNHLQLLLRDVRLTRMLSMPYIPDETLSQYADYIASIAERFPDARIDHARVLMHVGRLPDAVAKLREFIELEPDNVIGNYFLGEVFARSLRLQDSIRHLKVALGHCEGYGIAAELLDSVTKAQTLSKLPAVGPESRDVLPGPDVPLDGLLALGDLFLWLEDPSYAEALFAQAVGLGGDSADAHVGLARAHFAGSAENLWRPSPKMRLNLLLAASNELDVTRRLNPEVQVSLAKLAEDLRMQRMQRDSLQVASAIALYMRDTGRSPGQAYQWLFTDSTGRMPRVDEGIDFVTLAAPCSDFLVSNAEGIAAWHGPYLLASGSDAWENRYLISLAGSSGEKEAEPKSMIISAGPDGMLQTRAGSAEPGGDDVGFAKSKVESRKSKVEGRRSEVESRR